jgi:prefoldin alpha subunit
MTKENKETKTVKLNKDQTISLYKYKETEIRRISLKLQEVENILSDINKAERTIEEIRNIKTKEKIMVNIGAGVLIPCEVENTKEVQVVLPGSIIVKKDISKILEDFKKRKEDLEEARKKLIETYQQNIKTLESIQNALQKMSAAQKNNNQTNVN